MRDVAELNGDGIAVELRDAVHALNEALGSPVNFRPLEHGADVVIHSGTKYLNGVFTVTREVKGPGGAVKVPADYSQLGELFITIHAPLRSFFTFSKSSIDSGS